MCRKSFLSVIGFFCCSVVLLGCSENHSQTPAEKQTTQQKIQTKNTHFQDIKDSHFKPPELEVLNISSGIPGAAVWGATGRDNDGNMYFGLSTYNSVSDTSYLVQFDPENGTTKTQSDTVTQLKRSGLHYRGMAQIKLHSKFLMADDGYLYFASFDEKGESDSKNPIYGGNLWRKRPESNDWEHLLATSEALIAVQTNSKYVYALGYWGHALYQYDTTSGASKREMIGSIDGHISRNFVVNERGSIFVPKVEQDDKGKPLATLMELNSNLTVTDIHPLSDYINTDGYGDHGIVAYTLMQNGDAYFTVASGGLYQITESSNARHQVNYLGKFEPQFNNSYIASMFSPDGENLLVGIGRNKETEGYYWYIRELSTQVSVNYQLDELPSNNYLLYGSHTIDDMGNLYIVGRDTRNRSKHKPVVIKASYRETN